MEVRIDIQLLLDNDITADEYVALYALLRNGKKTLASLNLVIDWEKLQEKSFVKLGSTVDNHTVRQEFINLFSSDFDQMFAELLSTYPMKVNTENGVRVLHALDPDCQANKKAKNKYKKIVGTKKFVHNRIIQLLKVQLGAERNRLAYMQNLETWLNNHTWEKYANIKKSHGEDDNRITRKL
tara:strand:- start:20 stop:565 length:546 start_codon:yes stop_codon:yes gene_type:complete